MGAYFSQMENDSPTTNIHFLHSQQIFLVLVCIRAGNPRVPPRVLASGPNGPAGAIKHAHIQVKNYAILDAMSSKAKSFFQVTRV